MRSPAEWPIRWRLTRTASVTEASSSSVTTRSPISMVCPSGVRANATHDPSDSAGATVTPLVCTLRSERANPIL